MADPRVDAMAKVLVGYSIAVRPNELVRIEGNTEASPLLVSLYREVLQSGGNPYLEVGLEDADELLYRYGSDAQLEFAPPFLMTLLDGFDANIGVRARTNTKRLASVDPAKQARRARSRRAFFERFMERAANKELRWSGTLFPTQAFAQEAEMSLVEFEDFVFGACRVEELDPIAAWQEVSRRQAKIVDWLGPRSRIHLVGLDTDLRLATKGRPWMNCDGHENFPDGEIFTSPVEDSIEGTIRFTYPGCLYGREVEDVRLTFRKGQVVEAHASKNQAFLDEMLEVDDGARYVGEFAFGMNPGIQRFTKNTLFDEKIAGTVHLALGKGFPQTASKNSSAIHWDIVTDLRGEGYAEVDGEKFVEKGKILVH
jgi:aminopeptidase